jgi:hypothetical protein
MDTHAELMNLIEATLKEHAGNNVHVLTERYAAKLIADAICSRRDDELCALHHELDQIKAAHEAERVSWQSLNAAWGCFHLDPDRFRPYVELSLNHLRRHGVSEHAIKAMTPFGDRVGSQDGDMHRDTAIEVIHLQERLAVLESRKPMIDKLIAAIRTALEEGWLGHSSVLHDAYNEFIAASPQSPP